MGKVGKLRKVDVFEKYIGFFKDIFMDFLMSFIIVLVFILFGGVIK